VRASGFAEYLLSVQVDPLPVPRVATPLADVPADVLAQVGFPATEFDYYEVSGECASDSIFSSHVVGRSPPSRCTARFTGQYVLLLALHSFRACLCTSDFAPSTVFAFGENQSLASVPGPTIVATAQRPVVIKWRSALPATHILPVDATLLGATAPTRVCVRILPTWVSGHAKGKVVTEWREATVVGLSVGPYCTQVWLVHMKPTLPVLQCATCVHCGPDRH